MNPRVVNGSQTLHSISEVDHPSRDARVMVRIIQVPTSQDAGFPDREQKKEIIRNICLRSNQQNPIRRYDLVSNDDFQQELSRYFRDKQIFYERRRGEWKYKGFQLKSVGIERGPGVPWMTQLISAFHYDRKKLGPAVAQGKLKELFDAWEPGPQPEQLQPPKSQSSSRPFFIARKLTITYPDTGGLRSAARRLACGLQESLQDAAGRTVYKIV
jgi:AIPR protein